MMPILHFVRRDHARAVGPEQQRLLVRVGASGRAPRHVAHRDALGDADRPARGRRRRPPGWRRRRRRAARRSPTRWRRSAPSPRATVSKIGMPSKSSPAFSGVTPATRPCRAVLAALPRVEQAGVAGDSLRDDLGVLVEQDRHVLVSFVGAAGRQALAAASTASLRGLGHGVRRDDRQAGLGRSSCRAPRWCPSCAPRAALQAHLLGRRDDALGDHVAAHDAAEDVDEDRLQLRDSAG